MSNNTEESRDGVFKIPKEIGAEKMLVFQPDFLQAIGVTVPLNSLQNYLQSTTVDQNSAGNIDQKVKLKHGLNAAKKTRGKKYIPKHYKMLKTLKKSPSCGFHGEKINENLEKVADVNENLHDSKLQHEHSNDVQSDVAIIKMNPIFEERCETSILQTCNLLKESVLLSPSFTNHVTLTVKDNESQLGADISDLANFQENKSNWKSEIIINEKVNPHQMHTANFESRITTKNLLFDSKSLEDKLQGSTVFISSPNVHAVSKKTQHSSILEEALTVPISRSNELAKTFLPEYIPIEDSVQSIQSNCETDINEVNEENQSFINKYMDAVNCSDDINIICGVSDKYSEIFNEGTTEKQFNLQNYIDGTTEMPLTTIKINCATNANEKKVSILSEKVIKRVQIKADSNERENVISSIEDNQVHVFNILENDNSNGNIMPEKKTDHLYVDGICISNNIGCSSVTKCLSNECTIFTKIYPKQYFIKSKDLLNQENEKHDAVPQFTDESTLQQNKSRFPPQIENSDFFSLRSEEVLFKPTTTEQTQNDKYSVAESPNNNNVNLQLQVECNQILHDKKSVSVLLERKEESKVSNSDNDEFLSKQCVTGLGFHNNGSLAETMMLIKNTDQLPNHNNTDEMQNKTNTCETLIPIKNKDSCFHLNNVKEMQPQFNYYQKCDKKKILTRDIIELVKENPLYEHVEHLNKVSILNLNESQTHSGNESLILTKSHINVESDFKMPSVNLESIVNKSINRMSYPPKVTSKTEITESPLNVHNGCIYRINGKKSQNLNITDHHSKSESLLISFDKKNIRTSGVVKYLNVKNKKSTASNDFKPINKIDFLIAPEEVNTTVIAKCLKKAIDKKSRSLNCYHNRNRPSFQRFVNSPADNKVDKSIEFSWLKSKNCVNLKTYSRKNKIVPNNKNTITFCCKTYTSANNASHNILPIDCDIKSDTHTIDFPLHAYSQFILNIGLEDNDNYVTKMLHVTNNDHNMIEFTDKKDETIEDLKCTSMLLTPEEEGQCQEFNKVTEAILTAKENVELFQNILPKEKTQLLFSNVLFQDYSLNEDKCNLEDDDLLDINTDDVLNFSSLFSDDYGDNSFSDCNFDNIDSTLENIVSDNDIFMNTSSNDIITSDKIPLLSNINDSDHLSSNLVSPEIKCKLVKTELIFDAPNVCGDMDKVCEDKDIEIHCKKYVNDLSSKSNTFNKNIGIIKHNVDICMETSEDKNILSNSCAGMSNCGEIKVGKVINNHIESNSKNSIKLITTTKSNTLNKNIEITKHLNVISMETSEDTNILSNSCAMMSTCDDIKVNDNICSHIDEVDKEINKHIENYSNHFIKDMTTQSNNLIRNKEITCHKNVDSNVQTNKNKNILSNSRAGISTCDDIKVKRHGKEALKDKKFRDVKRLKRKSTIMLEKEIETSVDFKKISEITSSPLESACSDTLFNTNENSTLLNVKTSDTNYRVSLEETVLHDLTEHGLLDNTREMRAKKNDEALKSDTVMQSRCKVKTLGKKEHDPGSILDIGQTCYPSKEEEPAIEKKDADTNDNVINSDTMCNIDITVPFKYTSENCSTKVLRRSKINSSNQFVNTESDDTLSSNTSEIVLDNDKASRRSNSRIMHGKDVKKKKIESEKDDSKQCFFNKRGKPPKRKAGVYKDIENRVQSVKPAVRCTQNSAGMLDGEVAAKMDTPDIKDIPRTTKRQNACMSSSIDTDVEEQIQMSTNELALKGVDFESTPVIKEEINLKRRNPIKRKCGSKNRRKIISLGGSHDVLKCGVCLKNLEKCEWLPHTAKEHNYMGWIDGETPLNLADNKCVILHLQKIVQSTNELVCTVCEKKFNSARRFWIHIRRCTEENNATPHTETSNTIASVDALADENIKDSTQDKPNFQISSVTCAICNWEGKEESWIDHIFKEHEYLAWRNGDPALDFKNEAVLQEHLRNILKQLSKLTCHKCGVDRKYVNNYIKHIKTCSGAVHNNSTPHTETNTIASLDTLADENIKDSKLDLQISKVTCAICNWKGNEESWIDHIFKEHEYLAWRDGEPALDFKNKVVLQEHLKNILKLLSKLTCHKCGVDRKYVNNYIKHVKACSEAVQKSIDPAEPEPQKNQYFSQKERNQREPKLKSYSSQKEREQRERNVDSNSLLIERKQGEPNVDSNSLLIERKQGEPNDDSNSLLIERKQGEPNDDSNSLLIERKQGEPNDDSNSLLIERKQGEPNDDSNSLLIERKQGEPNDDSNSLLIERKQGEPNDDSNSLLIERKQGEPNEDSNSLLIERKQGAPNKNLNSSRKAKKRRRVSSESDNISLKKLKQESEAEVKCARCQECVQGNKWNEHLFKHDYIAWKDGEVPVDLENPTSVNRQLRKSLDCCKVFTCRLCDTQLTSVTGYQCHIRRCEEKKHDLETGKVSKRYIRKPDIVLPTLQQPTTDPVKCAVCSKEMPKKKWFSHLEEVHYNLAWFEGGTPFDIMDYNTCYIILNDLCKKLKKLECVKCGLTRISGAGFYAHIIVCQKSVEEIDAMKEPCEVCGRRYLPLYHSTHMSVHRRLETADDAAPAPDPAPVPAPADSSSPGTPGTKRRRAAVAAKAIIEKITTELVESKQSCTGCGFEADTKKEFDKHHCGTSSVISTAFSDDGSEPEVRWESESEESESAVDSELSAEESPSPPVLSSDGEGPDCTTSREKKKYERIPYNSGQDDKFFNKGFYANFVKELCDTHFTTEVLFPEMVCQEFVRVPSAEAAHYMPPLQRSCSTVLQKSHSEVTTQWESLDVFRSDYVCDVHRLFAGGPVTGVAWAPPADRSSRAPAARHLAAACQRDPDMAGLAADGPHSHRALIQLWCFDDFDQSTPARFVLGIAHEHGTVWALEWCPSGGCDERAGRPRRLGLLAAACSNGTVYIYAVCHADQLPPSENPIYRTKPAMELRLSSEGSSRQIYQATALHWSMQKGHSMVSVGYADGTFALYDISTDSPLLRKTQPGHVTVLNPYYDSQVASCTINALSVVPAGAGREMASDAWTVWTAVRAERAAVGAAVLSSHRLGLNGVLFPPVHPSHPLTEDPIHLYSDGTEYEEWAALMQRQLVGAPAAACPYSRRLVLASATGQMVVWRYIHPLQQIKRHILFTIDMKPLQDKKIAKKKANDKLETKLEPFSYKEVVEKYGLVCSTNNKFNSEGMKADLYPLSSVTCLAFCPSARDFNRLACAGPAGLIFVCKL